LIAILEKEKHIAEEEEEEEEEEGGRKWYAGICNIITNLPSL
jgi:hypothetical protein